MKDEPSRDTWPIVWKTALLTAFLTTGSNVVFHFWEASQKAKWTVYEHKEARYRELVQSLRVLQTDARLQNIVESNKNLLEQIDLCLMYCSDDVIRESWGLIDKLKPENAAHYGPKAGEEALKSILYAIRKDMFDEVGMKTKIQIKEIYLSGLSLEELEGPKSIQPEVKK